MSDPSSLGPSPPRRRSADQRRPIASEWVDLSVWSGPTMPGHTIVAWSV